MKISYSWLKELTGLDWPVEEMGDRLTLCGTACEEIDPLDRHLDKVVVGEVTDLQPIEGADKIRKATVNIGDETLDLVCGAPNVAVGQKVAVAQVGAEMAGGLKIKKSKIRGIPSAGMICAADELGLFEDHSGIMVLDESAVPGTPLVDLLDLHDYVMGFELTPNRADSMSAIGIARDLAALASIKVKYPEYELKQIAEKASDHIKVSIEDPDACPRFTARIIRNVKIGPSPWWVQKKLIGAGIRPISNVVDVTNLIMIESGNPVHAFDLDNFGSDEVVVRRAKNGETLKTLDGKDHELTEEVLLITNGKEAKAAAGVMGGFDSEVTDDTKNILLEAAYFDPSVIRKSRKYLGFVTEASTRFEKGVDPNHVQITSEHVAALFQQLCGGEVLDGIVDCYPKKIEPNTVELRPKRCCDIMGIDVSVEKMTQIFRDLEFEVEGTDPLKVSAPTFRHDIEREIDLIEEVARIMGFDAIPDSTDALGPLFTPTHEEDIFEDEVRVVLTGAGYDEIMGHGLADSRLCKVLNPELPQLKILSPVSEELDIMRNDLAHTGLSSVAHNLAHRNLDMRLFEIGRVYFPPNDKDEWIEEDRLMCLVTGNTTATWRDRPRELDFYDLTAALDALAERFHWPKLGFEPEPINYFEKEISFAIMLGDRRVGTIGRVSNKTARKFEVKQPVYLAQMSMDVLRELACDLAEFTALPTFPAALRDLALVVDTTVKVGDIVDLVAKNAGKMAESIDIFDLYTGKQIGDGKKSVGVSITYRSPERSLSSEEIDKTQEKIITRLKKQFNAEIRDK